MCLFTSVLLFAAVSFPSTNARSKEIVTTANEPCSHSNMALPAPLHIIPQAINWVPDSVNFGSHTRVNTCNVGHRLATKVFTG